MGKTTITVDDTTLDRLDNYQFQPAQSREDVIEMMMNILPTVEEIDDGCIVCEDTPRGDGPLDERYGVISWFTTDTGDQAGLYTSSNYFCSRECAKELEENIQRQFPDHPDLVIVGGKDKPRIEIEGNTRFIIDGTQRELTFELPCLYSEDGTWEGEPAYIKKDGKWVQAGVLENVVIEDDGNTYTILEYSGDVDQYHPDPDKRDAYKSRQKAES